MVCIAPWIGRLAVEIGSKVGSAPTSALERQERAKASRKARRHYKCFDYLFAIDVVRGATDLDVNANHGGVAGLLDPITHISFTADAGANV